MYIPSFIQPCALALVFLPVSDGALADPWALPLQSVLFFPTSATFSPHHADAEGKTVVGQLTDSPCRAKQNFLCCFYSKVLQIMVFIHAGSGAEPSDVALSLSHATRRECREAKFMPAIRRNRIGAMVGRIST